MSSLVLAAATAGDGGGGIPEPILLLVAGLALFYGGRRAWWKLIGPARRERLSRAQRAEMYRRWGEQCAYRRAMLPFAGPFFCRGAIQGGHQVARAKGGRMKAGNLYPLCQRHNRKMGTSSNLWWSLTRAIPLLGHWTIFYRWTWAEGIRRRFRG
jgi:hypothetical protein